MAFYFGYGANMDKEVMDMRSTSYTRRFHGTLKGYKLKFHKKDKTGKQCSYANVVPDEDSIVEGIIYETDDGSIKKLDFFEGYGVQYTREKLVVCDDEGNEYGCEVYIAMPDKIDENLKPTKKYINHLLGGKDLLSEEYCKKIENIETCD